MIYIFFILLLFTYVFYLFLSLSQLPSSLMPHTFILFLNSLFIYLTPLISILDFVASRRAGEKGDLFICSCVPSFIFFFILVSCLFFGSFAYIFIYFTSFNSVICLFSNMFVIVFYISFYIHIGMFYSMLFIYLFIYYVQFRSCVSGSSAATHFRRHLYPRS